MLLIVDTNTIASDSNEEDDSLDLQSSSSQVTAVDTKNTQETKLEVWEQIYLKYYD